MRTPAIANAEYCEIVVQQFFVENEKSWFEEWKEVENGCQSYQTQITVELQKNGFSVISLSIYW